MDFIKIFEKYKTGDANEEEKSYIEEEIKKNELISEYLAEKYDFDNIIIDTKNKINIKTVEIKRNVNKKIIKIIATSVLLVFALLILFNSLKKTIDNNMYYNPTAKTVGQKYHNDFFFDLRAYTEVSLPGYAVQSIYAYDDGEAKYDISFSRVDLFTKKISNISAAINKGLRQGTFEDFSAQTYYVFGGLWEYAKGEQEHEEWLSLELSLLEQELEHSKQLPKTSYISAYVLFNEDISLEDCIELWKNYKVEFPWVAVKTDDANKNNTVVGFRMLKNGGGDASTGDRPNEKLYPALQYTDSIELVKPNGNYFIERYSMHFISLLKYLSDREEATYALSGGKCNYKGALEYVKKNGIKIRGALLYAEVDELIKFIENENVVDLFIDNVLPSKYAGNVYK